MIHFAMLIVSAFYCSVGLTHSCIGYVLQNKTLTERQKCILEGIPAVFICVIAPYFIKDNLAGNRDYPHRSFTFFITALTF